MSDENIVIEIADKVSPAIVDKIRAIGDIANQSYSHLELLQKSLNSLNTNKLASLLNSVSKTTLASALNQEKLTLAQTNGAIASEKLAKAQSQAATAAAQASKAQDLAATSALRLKDAQERSAGSGQGASLLEALREQVRLYGKTADEILKYRAAQAGVLSQASPLILQLQNIRAANDGIAESAKKAAREQALLASQNAAKSSFLTNLQSQSESIGKTNIQLLEMRAAQMGVTQQAAPFIAKLKEAEQASLKSGIAFNENGRSAKQLAFAMRGVPAQITDIIVSLQGGQAPLTVLLQQGGQLKDMFGGIGAAARALMAALAAMITITTVIIGVLALLAAAFVVGDNELRNFTNAATISGNAAGMTADKFSIMTKELDGIATRGKAAEVLTKLAETGRFTQTSIKGISETAILMEKATGQSIDKTINKFVELADLPSKASQELNKQYNYLTASVYEQIKALEKQERFVEAANLAEKTYSDSMTARARQVVDNAGLMERAWRGVMWAAKEAWDAMANVGRPTQINDQIADIEKQLAIVESRKSVVGGLPGLSLQNREMESRLGAQLAALKATQYANEQNAAVEVEKQAIQNAGNKAIDKLTTANDKYASKQAKVNKELGEYNSQLEAIRKANPNSELLNPTLVAATRKGIADQNKGEQTAAFNDTVNSKIEKLKGAQKLEEKIAKETVLYVNNAYKNGEITQIESINTIAEAEKAALLSAVNSAKGQLELAQTKTKNKKELATLEGAVSQAEQNYAIREIVRTLDIKDAYLAAAAEKQKFYNESERIAISEIASLVEKNKTTKLEIEAMNMSSIALQNLIRARTANAIGIQEEKIATMQLFNESGKNTASIQLEIDKLNQLKIARDLQSQSDNKTNSPTGVTSTLGGMGLDTTNMQVQAQSYIQIFQDMYAEIDLMRMNQLINDEDYFAARSQIAAKQTGVQLQGAKTFYGGLVELQSSSVKEFARIGKAAAIIQATINTYEGATKALAQGGIYGPLMAGVVVAQGLSQIAAIRAQGFQSGGYTGNIATNEIAGVVHGKEYVMNAQATQRIGVGNLQALEAGATSVSNNSSGATEQSSNRRGSVSIVVENHGTPQEYQQTSGTNENDIRLIAMDVMRKETPNMMASQAADIQSPFRKSMNTHTNITRKVR